MKKKLTVPVLCAIFSISPLTWAEHFPEAGVDTVPSSGAFEVIFTANFIRTNPRLQSLGFCSDLNSRVCTDEMRMITSVLLHDAQAKYGRSSPHMDGDVTDERHGTRICQEGNRDSCMRFGETRVKDSSFVESIFPSPITEGDYGEDGPVGTEEVHIQILSLNMKNQDSANAIRAGSAAPTQPRSLGEMESLNPPDSSGGFPAESFINLYLEVDIDFDSNGTVDLVLYNKASDPLVILKTGLTQFPPKSNYTYISEWAVPVYAKNARNDFIVAYLRLVSVEPSTVEPSEIEEIVEKEEIVEENETNPLSCKLYVLQDHGLNNSQFYSISPDTLEVNPLSQIFPKHDLEALATHPVTDKFYVASGNDTKDSGYLYSFNVNTAELTKIGDTSFGDVPSIAFDSKGILWGWVKGKGLITIDVETGQGTMVKEFPGVLIEDITWNNAGTHIYGSENTNLWAYEYATQTAKLACNNLPGETEALEILPDGSLLLGIHGGKKILQFQAINVETCEIVFGVDIPTSNTLNDVEGITWPLNACSQP